MKIHPDDAHASRLEDLPNIGKSIAGDLRSLGILNPADLARRAPLDIFLELGAVMGKRHDPCVFYTLLAAEHFLKTAESVPWWHFTAEGKRLLRENS
ncbi:MAG: helix-hairpin-helix domain-containing protein [Verrucomicrobiota bacterium]